MQITFALNLDSAPTAKSSSKSVASMWSVEDTRDSDSVELVGDWEQSYTKTMEKIHKVTVPKQSSKTDEVNLCGETKEEETDQENQEEDNNDNDDGTLKEEIMSRSNKLWAPMIQKRTRSRIQDIADEEEEELQGGEEEEEDSESDGLFGLEFDSDDDADNEEEQDEEEYRQNQSTKRVLVFDEWDVIIESILYTGTITCQVLQYLLPINYSFPCQ